jgi:hypothetical protein
VYIFFLEDKLKKQIIIQRLRNLCYWRVMVHCDFLKIEISYLYVCHFETNIHRNGYSMTWMQKGISQDSISVDTFSHQTIELRIVKGHSRPLPQTRQCLPTRILLISLPLTHLLTCCHSIFLSKYGLAGSLWTIAELALRFHLFPNWFLHSHWLTRSSPRSLLKHSLDHFGWIG